MSYRVLSADQVAHFWSEGYVLVAQAATPEETRRAHAAIMDLLPGVLTSSWLRCFSLSPELVPPAVGS